MEIDKICIEYLAVPYSHPDPEIRELRFQLANRIASILMQEGRFIYSPISHSHPIALYGLPKGWDFWQKYDIAFLHLCKKMIIVMLDGWEESVGIKNEIEIMQQMNKPIEYLRPEDYGI